MLSALIVLLLAPQWTREAHQDPTVYLRGFWQSCPNDDPELGWTEHAIEHTRGRDVDWSIHLGPRTDFALFRGPVPDVHVSHEDPSNLLGPGHDFASVPMANGMPRRWQIPSLGMELSVWRVGGSYEDCESFYLDLSAMPRVQKAAR